MNSEAAARSATVTRHKRLLQLHKKTRCIEVGERLFLTIVFNTCVHFSLWDSWPQEKNVRFGQVKLGLFFFSYGDLSFEIS